MLSIFADKGWRDCDGLGRRDFLRAGALGLGGFALPWFLQQETHASPSSDYIKDTSVVLLFLCGGPSHIETFDPNMDAPAARSSLTGEVKTVLPGVTFGGTFPKLAALADRLAVVRSYSPHQIADHATAIHHVFTVGNALGKGASIGAMANHLRGKNLTASGVPAFAQLIENEIDPQYMEDMQRMRSSNSAGELAASCAAFDPLGKGQLKQDMTLNVPLERLNDRRRLHRALDRLNRRVDATGDIDALDDYHQQAVDLILGGATRRALDLSKEDPRIVDAYDTSRFKTGFLKTRTSTLGRRLLMARRLCEAGCRFVTVGMAGWDNHGNGKHPGVREGMHLLGTPLDHAVAAFLEDVKQRGLSDKILLVITGEFGRTPRIEKQGGRDHWPGLCSLVFAGGGLKMGQVIGRSQRTADYPATDPLRLENFMATLMHAMFDIGQLRLQPQLDKRLLAAIERPKPIEALL